MPFLILLKNIILSIYSYSLCKAESPVTVAAPAVTTSLFNKMLYLLDINANMRFTAENTPRRMKRLTLILGLSGFEVSLSAHHRNSQD